MKGSVIALGQIAGREAAVRVVDGALDDLLIDIDDTQPRPGTIYRGICDRALKGAGAMIIRLPDRQTGYLRNAKGLGTGQAVLVQVTGYAEPGKAVPLAAKVNFKGRFALITPDAPGLNISRRIKDEEARLRLREILAETGADEAGFGVIIRSAAEQGSDDEIHGELTSLLGLAGQVIADTGKDPELLVEGPSAHELAMRDWQTADTFDNSADALALYGIPELLEALDTPRVKLGPYDAYIEPTRALVAVDVNTGADTSLAAGLKANIALARALPAQLRARGLGGQIVLDLAPMPKKERRGFEQILKAAFRADPIDTALAGWTPLGHFELQRKNERRPTRGYVTL